MAALTPESRALAAQAYLDTLAGRGLSLRYVDDGVRRRFIIPAGHTPAEVELVRFLKVELRDLLTGQAQERVAA